MALPSGKIPDGIFLQAGLAVFALRERYPFMRANKNIAPPFKSLRRQSSLPASPKTKKPAFEQVSKYFTGEGTCLPVKFLTEFSCRPGSRFLPCAKGTLLCAQTKTSLRLSSPYAGKAVCLLPRKQKNLLLSRFLNILPGKGLAFR